MHEHVAFLLAALLNFIFGLFSRLSERLPITAPMFFAGVGILVSPLGFGWFDVKVDADLIKVLAEITLMLVLFTDGSEINVRELVRQRTYVPLRLLAIGLPLTMLLGIGAGFLILDQLSLWQIALVALILSPTDAALGQAVVKIPLLPESLKRSISVESGINDGIALPPVLVCMAALPVETAAHGQSDNWLHFLFVQLTLGPLVGAAVGWLGGRLVETAASRDWMGPVFQRLSAMSLAVLAFAFAEMIHGNGFIAAFVAGLTLGVQTSEIRHRIQEFGEAEGQQLALFIFLILGMVGVPMAYLLWDWAAFIYALLSLTIIRMLPVALSLMGSGLDLRTSLFIGWFGPRGYSIGVISAHGHRHFRRRRA